MLLASICIVSTVIATRWCLLNIKGFTDPINKVLFVLFCFVVVVFQHNLTYYLSNHILLMYNVLSVLVSNLALVKPDKAKAVENYLIQMARMGQLGGKVSHFCVNVISGGNHRNVCHLSPVALKSILFSGFRIWFDRDP